MKTKYICGLLATIFLSFSAHAADQVPAPTDKAVQAAYWAEFMGTYKNIGEVLESYAKWGILFDDDVREIKSELTARNIPLNTPMPTFKADGTQVVAGHLKIEVTGKSTYRLGNGKTVEITPKMSAGAVFIAMLSAALPNPNRPAFQSV
jgi:hypothetical protein